VKKCDFRVFPFCQVVPEAKGIWGGTVKRILIAYFIGNTYAKKYQNAFMYVKVIANQRWDIFWRHSVDGDGLESLKGRRRRLLFS